MTTVSNACASGRKGDHYGAKLECPAILPGFVSAIVPWEGRREYKELLLDMRRMFAIIVLCRDKGSGEVRLDAEGEPVLNYPLHPEDAQSIVDGMEVRVYLFWPVRPSPFVFDPSRLYSFLPSFRVFVLCLPSFFLFFVS